MKKVNEQTLATIDQLVLAKYPSARKVDDKIVQENLSDFDGFYPIAHYVILEIPGANDLGFNDDHDEYEVVAVSFSIHDETDRIFFWELNNYGEPDCSYGESNGELMTDSIEPYLVFETAREHEVYNLK